jgi:periplasmic divalent cation tolerance protein
MKLCEVHTTVSNKNNALEMARNLVDKKLAACVNIVENVTSVYSWKGKTDIDLEVLLIIKTRENLYPEVQKAIKEMHEYETPCIISVPLSGVDPDYMDWVKTNTSYEKVQGSNKDK